MSFVIRTAAELLALDTDGRSQARRAARETPVATRILRAFLDEGGPIPVDEIDVAPVELARLHDDDLIRIHEGWIDVAYPFSAASTSFLVGLPEGGHRYACCATDALGFAPMIGTRVAISSRCHRSGAPLAFDVTPDGPEPDAASVMLWVGQRGDAPCRAIDGL
ncbi:MAG TPA: organomercurial lyase [Methylomirabilota bacterium]